MKQSVTLEIAGARYRMSSDAGEEHLQQLAAMVNERIAKLGERASRTTAPAQLLALVALGLADDLVAAERKRKSVEDATRTALSSAIDRIDRRLEADARRARESDPP